MRNPMISDSQERSLRERLCQEAAETRPAYSPRLHGRILAAIQQMSAEERLASVSRREVQWAGRIAALCAAACLLMAVVAAWQMMHPIAGPNAGQDVVLNLPQEAVTPDVEVAADVKVTPEEFAAMEMALADADVSMLSIDANDASLVDSQLSLLAGATTVAGLSALDEVIGQAVEDFSNLIAMASPAAQSADLKHDTRLAARSLLLRLPISDELVSEM